MEYKKVENKTEKELKKIAIDLFDGKIYTSLELKNEVVERHFMPLMFIYPQPPYSGELTLAEIRANKIWKILYESVQKEKCTEFLKSIGIVYEYLNNETTFPRSLNGKPIFNSCKFLSIEDSSTLFKYFDEYKKLREQVDNF